MSLEATREEALKRRKQLVEILQACQCTYPVQQFRNVSGHSTNCPSHALFLKYQ